MNYGSITLLMAAESSILPVPSELVIPPAAYIASKPESDLNIFLVILFGTIGALIGATVNYLILGMWLGRAVMYRFADSKIGHLLLLSGEKLQKAEDYFNAHGIAATFIGRFIPVIRHFISIPAGFAKMNFATFALFTFIGAGLWNCCLAALGYFAHGQADMIDKYSHELSIGIIILTVLAVVYFVVKKFLLKKKK
ncbi:MAG: DedA family protein [Prevotellaceae bacterium]|nr:DedA family protein [Prevotellaceae bacterium]